MQSSYQYSLLQNARQPLGHHWDRPGPSSLGIAVEVVAAPLRGSNEIEAAMAQWGPEPNFGLIVIPDPATNAHRKLINKLAAR